MGSTKKRNRFTSEYRREAPSGAADSMPPTRTQDSNWANFMTQPETQKGGQTRLVHNRENLWALPTGADPDQVTPRPKSPLHQKPRAGRKTSG